MQKGPANIPRTKKQVTTLAFLSTERWRLVIPLCSVLADSMLFPTAVNEIRTYAVKGTERVILPHHPTHRRISVSVATVRSASMETTR